MRAIVILLCLATATANAQSGGYRAPPEDTLTPPPITPAPRDELPPPPPPSTPAPEEDFLPLPPPPPKAAEPAVTPPPLPPRVTAEPSPPAVIPPPPTATVLPPPPPPPSEPQRVQPPLSTPATGPAEPASSRAQRHSRYSAGSGGSTLVLTAGLSGLVNGAMLGSAFNSSGSGRNEGYTGAVIGGLSLGTAAILYQYFIPVGRREGMLAAGAATSSFVASLVVAHSENLDARDRALLTFTSSQAAIVATLLLTAGGEDVSSGDAGLVGATSLYGLIITSLVEYIHSRQTLQAYNAVPVLLAPALGMAVGGLLALPLEVSSALLFELTAFPLATGSVALLIGSRLADGVTVAKTVLVTMGGTFFVVGLINALSAHSSSQEMSPSASTFQAMPVPVVLSAGRRNEGLAAGAGLFMRF